MRSDTTYCEKSKAFFNILLVTFTAGGLEEIAWWVLSWGKEVKVIGSPELVELIKEQLTKTLQHYTSR